MDVEAIVARIWPGEQARVEVLGGGITNHNFRVALAADTYVLRVAGRIRPCSGSTGQSSTRRLWPPPPSVSGPTSSRSSSRRATS